MDRRGSGFGKISRNVSIQGRARISLGRRRLFALVGLLLSAHQNLRDFFMRGKDI